MSRSYRVPFPEGTEYSVAKPTGMYAHENFPEIEHAKDLLVSLGTEVIAREGGTVFMTKKDSTTHLKPEDLVGKDIDEIKSLASKYTNFVCIEHGDGTYVEFLHLGTDIPVNEGDRVESGELIGYIGLTGVMSEPHLHLNLFEITEGKARSIPFELTD